MPLFIVGSCNSSTFSSRKKNKDVKDGSDLRGVAEPGTEITD